MSALVGGNLDRMGASRRGMRVARSGLEGLGSQANGISPPSHPAALRGRIHQALTATNRTAQSGQRQLAQLELDLQRRELLLLLADTVGSLTPLKAAPRLGSVEHTPDGVIPDTPIPGLTSDHLGAMLGGLNDALGRYSKEFTTHSVTTMRIERELRTSYTVAKHNGKMTITALTREIERIHISTDVTRTAVKYAQAARYGSKALGILGHVDNGVTVIRSFGVKGPEKASAVGGAVGKASGGMAAAMAGGSLGASLGAPGGPIGIAVGAGIGATVGGIIGSKAGNKAGAALGEGARQTGKALGDAADKAGDTAKRAADHAKHALGDTKRKLGRLF